MGHRPEGENVIGKTYGVFKVTAYNGLKRLNAHHSIGIYHVVCTKCGAEYNRTLFSIRKNTGNGCFKCRKTTQTHGASKTRLYGIWINMKERCYSPNNEAYSRYGGRGITVCGEWKEDFPAFQKWALSHGYKKSLSIDRINNDKGYSPNNCRWATDRRQALNRRSNRIISYEGKSLPIEEWGKKLGGSGGAIDLRLKRGWNIGKALTTPIRKIHRKGA